jgi:hemoglobin
VDRSLYERLGGVDAIMAVVRAVVDRQMKDDRINRKFARTNEDRLIKEFVDQICEATGGPCTYTGRSMTEAHTNMGVTNGEFDAFVEDVVAVLDDFKVGKAEQDELLNILAPLQGEIVEVDSSQVGTPLPSAFTPAPAL